MTFASMSYSYLFRLPFGISTKQVSAPSSIAGEVTPVLYSSTREMRLRVLAISLATVFVSLLLAVPALAEDGEGWYGETDDRVVTAFGLGLVLLFTLMVVVFSAIQNRGDKRKDEKKAAQARQRAGW